MANNNNIEPPLHQGQKALVKKQRITWLLILQGWAMLWVVIGHARLPIKETEMPNLHWLDAFGKEVADICVRFAYSFHMPLFIMISGYLFYLTRVAKNWKFIPMIKEKWVRLGIPYIFFIIIGILVKLIYKDGRPLDLSFMGLIRNFTHPFTGALQEMWFVASIILYFILFPLYNIIMRNTIATAIVWMIGCVMFFIPEQNVTYFLSINKSIHFFVFFFTGLIIAKWKFEKYISNQTGLLISLVVFTVATWLRIPLLLQFSGCAFFWGIATLVDRKLTNNIFSSFRDYTYQIFLVSLFAQMLVKVLYSRFHFPGSYLIWWTICILLGVYVPVIVCKFIERYNGPGAPMLRKCFGLN